MDDVLRLVAALPLLLAASCLEAEPASLEAEPGGEPPFSLAAAPACAPTDLHEFVRARVRGPRAEVTVDELVGEAALVFETAAGRRTAIDFDTQRASGDVHAELWIDGERIQTAQAVAGTYSYAPLYPAELDPTEAEVLSAGLILLSRRFAAAGCADCCEGARRLAAPLAAAHDLLRACLAGGVCCD